MVECKSQIMKELKCKPVRIPALSIKARRSPPHRLRLPGGECWRRIGCGAVAKTRRMTWQALYTHVPLSLIHYLSLPLDIRIPSSAA